MKVRQGFVSNSSSSSFIAATKNGKLRITLDIDLVKFSNEVINTMEELDKSEYFGCLDTDYLKRQYRDCVKALESGKSVFIGRFSDDSGDGVESVLCYAGLSDLVDKSEVDVILSEGGY